MSSNVGVNRCEVFHSVTDHNSLFAIEKTNGPYNIALRYRAGVYVKSTVHPAKKLQYFL
jgi:hypothetical protein